MKPETKNINYPLLVIKLLVVIMFVANLITGIIKLQDYFMITGDYNEVNSSFDSLILYSFFRQMIFLSIPMIGIFLRNKMGWILIVSYFYFLITNALATFSVFNYRDYRVILSVVITLALVSLVIISMNRKKISFTKYGIKSNALILYNIIAFTIGVSVTIFLMYDRA